MISVKINETNGQTRRGDIRINGRSGKITYYGDTSYEITPAWLESSGIQSEGSKGTFRRALDAAVEANQ